MTFSIHRTRNDCVIPAPALGVAGLKREKELRLEAENGVIVLLRPGMNAKKLLSVSEFLQSLAAGMIAAVAVESGECSLCGDCGGDESLECDGCRSRDECSGMEIPACLLERAGIGGDRGLTADAEDGAVTVRELPEDGDGLPDDIPEIARLVLLEAGICIPRLRELLCSNESIPF